MSSQSVCWKLHRLKVRHDRALVFTHTYKHTRGLRLPLMRSWAIKTTPVLKMNRRVSNSVPFFILPRSSLAFNQFTVPYICSSPTFKSTTWPTDRTKQYNANCTRRLQRGLSNITVTETGTTERHMEENIVERDGKLQMTWQKWKSGLTVVWYGGIQYCVLLT